MRMTIVTKNKDETARVAQEVARALSGGDVVALVGDLGAGKTTFTQALAKVFGVKRAVRSPTFVRVIPYRLPKSVRGIRTLVHVDAYRVTRPEEFLELGLDEYFATPIQPSLRLSSKERGRNAIVVIEWADRVKKVLPKRKTTWISFKQGKSPTERLLTISLRSPVLRSHLRTRKENDHRRMK